MYHAISAAPKAEPASPLAGCIQIFSKTFSLNNLPLATQFKATPPARQIFLIPVSFLRDLASETDLYQIL